MKQSTAECNKQITLLYINYILTFLQPHHSAFYRNRVGEDALLFCHLLIAALNKHHYTKILTLCLPFMEQVYVRTNQPYNTLCLVFCRYGFGKEGRAQYKIGPNSDLVYEVTLNNFQKVSYTCRIR